MIDFEYIRRAVSIYDVLAAYGIEVDRHGHALCPFHADHDPSLTVYGKNDSFYCFVCHAGGDQIHFVARMEEISNGEAARKVAEIGGLQGYENSVGREMQNRLKAERAKQERTAKELKDRYIALCAERLTLLDKEAEYKTVMDRLVQVELEIDEINSRIDSLGL